MPVKRFPTLETGAFEATRDALHGYSRVMGDWLKNARTGRKHWWHASLRPSLQGLSTGVVRANPDFEIELDLTSSHLRVATEQGADAMILSGQSAGAVAAWLQEALAKRGVDNSLAPGSDAYADTAFAGYSRQQASLLHGALASVAASLEVLRATIREETSPIQLWPHHFDLSMIWLPGHRIAGEDPADAESADKQMNFGFLFGDDSITSPYLYVTAYPLPDALRETDLPPGTQWRDDGFSGAALKYGDLVAMADPATYLQDLWSRLLAAGQVHLARND